MVGWKESGVYLQNPPQINSPCHLVVLPGDVGALAGHGLPALCRVSKSYPSSTASVWGVLLQAVYSLYLSTFVCKIEMKDLVCKTFRVPNKN